MKIPTGMTELEVVEQIEKVCNRIAPKYTFYGYTLDDIKQEAFIICMEASIDMTTNALLKISSQ